MVEAIKVESWVPELLQEDIRATTAARRKLQRYAERLLYDPRMEDAWSRLQRKEVDPVQFFYFVAEIGRGYSQNYGVKRLAPSALEAWKDEVRITARKLEKLVRDTPYDRIREHLHLTDRIPAHFRSTETLTEILDAIQVLSVEDLETEARFTRKGVRDSGLSNTLREFVVEIDQFLRRRTQKPMAAVNAMVVNSLMNKEGHAEISARDIDQIVRFYKKSAERAKVGAKQES